MSIIEDTNARIYVAGSTHPEQRSRVRAFTREVQDMGWVQTHPWLAEREAWEATGLPRTAEETIRCAYADSIGVRMASAFVFLVPPRHIATNASVEFGIAIGAKVPIVLVGTYEDLSCEFFATLCGCYPSAIRAFDEDEKAIEWLLEARLQFVQRWGA